MTRFANATMASTRRRHTCISGTMAGRTFGSTEMKRSRRADASAARAPAIGSATSVYEPKWNPVMRSSIAGIERGVREHSAVPRL